MLPPMSFVALYALGSALSAAPNVPVLECEFLPAVLQSLRESHYAREQVGPLVNQRSVEQFIKSLDPSRNLLLEADVAELRRRLPKVFETMRKNDCALLDEAWALIISRSVENEKIVKQLLGPKYKLDESVELDFDPERRGYAKTAKERAQLVEKLVHFQVSSLLIAKTTLPEAKKRVTHRFELATLRLRERAQNRELPGYYAEAYASSLDPHSSFMSARMLADFEISMRLSLEGIGAALTSRDGFTIIQSIVPGGQADKQNILRPKDKVMAVAQEGQEPVSVNDMDLRDVVAMIRGKAGTKVKLTILREGKETKTFDVSIVRGKIDVKEQAAKIDYRTFEDGGRKLNLAVLELPSFYGGDENGRSSYKDVKNLLEEAKKKKVDGVVLDLSSNGGGLLRDAVRISGLFIKTGGVVATRSSQGDVDVLTDDDPEVVWNGPLVVLTSPASASASEILAGALRDYRRAVVVGSANTFGKGTVQVLNSLPGQIGAVKITTGMFFLPSGASTQKTGVPSDIVIPSLFEGFDIGEANLDYSLPPQSVRPFVSPTANGLQGQERWKPVTPSTLESLRAKSQARVAASPAFAEIKKQVEEAKKNRGVLKLSELRKQAEKDGTSGEDEEASESDEKEKGLDKAVVDEAVQVLADLVRAG